MQITPKIKTFESFEWDGSNKAALDTWLAALDSRVGDVTIKGENLSVIGVSAKTEIPRPCVVVYNPRNKEIWVISKADYEAEFSPV